MRIGKMTLVVRDYDEALAWYVDKLGFECLEYSPLGGGKRWVEIAPRNQPTGLLLARAVNEAQAARIGNQTGGRVMGFLHSDDFASDHAGLVSRGVHFIEAPRQEPYGRVAVFEDLYGNRWDLVEYA